MSRWREAEIDEVCNVEYGTRVVKKRDAGTIYPVYGGGGATFCMDEYNRENRMVVARFGMSEECTRFVEGKFFLNDSGLTVSPKNEDEIYPRYLDYHLLALNDLIYSLSRGSAQRNLNTKAFRQIQLAFPEDLAEQKRIVSLLDEAFAAIDTATAHAQQNLTNARELFESHLSRVFSDHAGVWPDTRLGDISERVSVGHVGPTSKYYCDASEGVPLLRSQNVRRAKLNMAGVRFITREFHATLRKSTLRGGELLFVRVGANRGDCCALHEDVGSMNCANIVFARPRFQSLRFLEYYCNSEQGRERLLGMTTGSAQGVINTRSVADLFIPLPSLEEQESAALMFEQVREAADQLAALYTRKLKLLAELKQSILHKAFSGELTAEESSGSYLFPGVVPEQDTRELYAGILAIAYKRHEKRGKLPTFNDIKREKIIHLVEAHCDLSLGRTPCKIAAGPADLDRRDIVESYARDRGYFTVEPAPKGTYMKPGSHFDDLLRSVRKQLGARLAEVEAFIDLFVSMKTRQTEIIATAYSAWNNYLLDGVQPSVEQIIIESRENWHEKKLEIKPEEFRIQLNWMRANGVVPQGRGKRVITKQEAV